MKAPLDHKNPEQHRRKLGLAINTNDDQYQQDRQTVFVSSLPPNRIESLWHGTSAEYTALTPDADTQYNVTDLPQIYQGNIPMVVATSTRDKGYYNQVTDDVNGTGTPLDAASNYTQADYYTITQNGVFSTAIPELTGQNAQVGDQIIAINNAWTIFLVGSSKLSAVAKDTANEVITFAKGADSPIAAPGPNYYVRQVESEAGDDAVQASLDAHINTTAMNDDAHGSKTYADMQDAAHAALTAAADDVHEVQAVTGPIDSDLQAHKADTDIHWDDVPVDGVAKVRKDKTWQPAASLAVLYGQPANSSLGTGGFRLTNWSENGSFGLMAGAEDAAAGSITISETGPYAVKAYVIGDQGNSNKEESIWLQIEVIGGSNAGIYDIAHESVDTDKTSTRSLGVSATRGFEAGQVVYLRMRASTGLGTFSFSGATFELAKLI